MKPTYEVRLAEDEIDAVLDALVEECSRTNCPERAEYLHDLAHKFIRFVPPTQEEGH